MAIPDTQLLATLAARLSSSVSGEAFVAEALELLTVHADLREAVLVVNDELRGEKSFAAGSAIGSGSGVETRTETPRRPGIYTDPVLLDDSLQEAVRHLCLTALRIDELQYDAGHDALTGISNRRSFDDALAAACARSRRYGWEFTLALLDLDRFKQFNDTRGHSQGDVLLGMVGQSLRAGLRAGDVAARVGGDEFALIVEGWGVNAVAAIVHRLDRRLRGEGDAAPVGFSVGVAFAPNDSTDPSELYQIADARLYEAKLGN
jgi:diguanylate cyclase (GGDEF)-like protein